MHPQARRETLLVEELPDETLVYDLERHKAHCLNQTAARVWRHCDGRKDTTELARLLSAELGVEVGEQTVRMALHRLSDAHLLEEGFAVEAESGGYSRRRWVTEMGRVALAMPVVMSIVSPLAAQGASAISAADCKADPAANDGKCCTNNRLCRSNGQCNGAAC